MNKMHIVPDHFVLLDRDGVINVERGDYTKTIEEWKWAPGALEGIKRLTEAGFGIIVITNQSCISKEILTDAELAGLHEFMLGKIRESGGDILKIYHCPHQRSDGCTCRKPEPGMLLQAAKDYGINLSNTFFVGDAQRDMEAARRAGTRSIFINSIPEYSVSKSQPITSEYRTKNLLEAAEIVIEETIL